MQVQPGGMRDSMALFLQLEDAVASRGSLTPQQILELRASAAHLNVSGEHRSLIDNRSSCGTSGAFLSFQVSSNKCNGSSQATKLSCYCSLVILMFCLRCAKWYPSATSIFMCLGCLQRSLSEPVEARVSHF